MATELLFAHTLAKKYYTIPRPRPMAQQATMLYQALQQAGLGRWISAGIAMGKL